MEFIGKTIPQISTLILTSKFSKSKNQDKVELGIVKDIIPIRGNDILLFDDNEGEVMIPFAKDLIFIHLLKVFFVSLAFNSIIGIFL